MRNQLTSALLSWAVGRKRDTRYQGSIEISEPAYENGGYAVDIDLEHTLAQVLLWPRNGSLEIRIIDVETGSELAIENHVVEKPEELSIILSNTELLILRNEIRSS